MADLQQGALQRTARETLKTGLHTTFKVSLDLDLSVQRCGIALALR